MFHVTYSTVGVENGAGQQDCEVVMMTHPKPEDIEKPSDFEEQVGNKSRDTDVYKEENVNNSILYPLLMCRNSYTN